MGHRLFFLALAAVGICVSASAAVVRVTYVLTETQLDIQPIIGNRLGPYDVGPGVVVVDFAASGGQIADGPVQLRQYGLIQDFVVSFAGASVDNDLEADANFSGVQTSAAGNLSNGVITWSQAFPYRVQGTNTCQGNCALAGFQPGVPTDAAREDSVTFAPFRFGSGGPQAGAGFTGDELLLPGNASADTFLLLRAQEVRRAVVEPDAPDGCLPYRVSGEHTADRDCNGSFNLGEVLRVVQLFNAGRYNCALTSEDSYAPGPGPSGCTPHAADRAPSDFVLSLSELLRVIQLFTLQSFAPCDGASSEDGFCAASR